MALNLKSLKSTWYSFYHQFFLIVSITIQKSRKCSRYFKQNNVSNDHQGKPIQRCWSNGRKQLLLEERYPYILPSSLPLFLPLIFHSRFPLAELYFKSADRRVWKTWSVGVTPLWYWAEQGKGEQGIESKWLVHWISQGC